MTPPSVAHSRSRVVPPAAVLCCALLLGGCAALSEGPPTTTTVVTGSTSPSVSAGPGVELGVEPSVPDVVLSFDSGAAAEPAGGDATPGVELATDRMPATATTVRRAADGNLAVTTWGSVRCPRMPFLVTAVDPTTVEIATAPVRLDEGSEMALCVGDSGPMTSVVALPEGALGTGPLAVIVDGVRSSVA